MTDLTNLGVKAIRDGVIDATIDRDEDLLLGCVLYYGFLIVILNLVSDIIQASLNPRLRESL